MANFCSIFKLTSEFTFGETLLAFLWRVDFLCPSKWCYVGWLWLTKKTSVVVAFSQLELRGPWFFSTKNEISFIANRSFCSFVVQFIRAN